MQIATPSKLHENIDRVLVKKRVVIFDDILVLDFSHVVDLFEDFFELFLLLDSLFAVDLLELDFFDDEDLVVEARLDQENDAVGPLADLLENDEI